MFIAQVVVSSPLTRALETAVGAFGGGRWPGRGSVLMHEQTAIPGVRAAHDTVASVAGLPFIAFEGCRERLGRIFSIPLSFPPRAGNHLCRVFLVPAEELGHPATSAVSHCGLSDLTEKLKK